MVLAALLPIVLFFSVSGVRADSNQVWGSISPTKTQNSLFGFRSDQLLTKKGYRTHPVCRHHFPQSAQEWEHYFAVIGMSEEAILNNTDMLLNKNYREAAKKLPLYVQYIQKHNQYYAGYGRLKRTKEWLAGHYKRGSKGQFAALQQECLREENQRITVAKLVAKREQEARERAIYKDLRSQIANRLPSNDHAACTRQQNRLKAIDQTIKEKARRASHPFNYNQNIRPFAKAYGIEKEMLSKGVVNAYQYQLHSEFLEQLAVAAGLHDRYQEDAVKIFLEAVGNSSAQGILAIQNNQSEAATNWADVGWQSLEIAKGLGEGVGQGCCNLGNMVLHPMHTGETIVSGMVTMVELLGRATGTIAHLGYLQATGDHDKVCAQLHDIDRALDRLIGHCSKELGKMSNREIAKNAAAFATEMFLPAKALRVASNLSTRMRPLIAGCIQAMRKEEFVVELVGTGERILIQASEAAQQVSGSVAKVANITEETLKIFHADLMKGLESEIAVLRSTFDGTRKGFAEFANKYLKIDFEHIFGIDLSFNRKGALKMSGFHHDFMNKIENTGIVKFINKVTKENGIYQADLIINGVRVPKKTFFPAHWTRDKVVGVIYEVYDSAVEKGTFILESDGKYRISGFSSEGIEIEMFVTQKGKLLTVYPKI